MVRDPFAREPEPEAETVLGALDDPDCRDIIRCLEEPMTATELSEACEIPLSTTYRKLDRLAKATLLDEGTEIRPGGQHATRYEIGFQEVSLMLNDDRRIAVSIVRPVRAPEERLATLWSQVREES